MAEDSAGEKGRRGTAGERVRKGLGTSKYKEYGFVAPYAYIVDAKVSQESWDGVLFSWLSIKGHLQGLYGVQRIESFATNVEDAIHATFVIVFDFAETLAAWLEHGYTVEQMLKSMKIPDENISVSLKRDFT